MKKRCMKLMPVSLGILFLLIFLLPSCKQTGKQALKPNVVMIVVDDMNGYSVRDRYPLIKTPGIDKLRNESVNFINAVCNAPVCNPSRSSFFSGLYPHVTGAYLNGSDGWNRSRILREIRSLPECFKDNGYTTWGRGKIFHSPLDSAREHAMWDNRPVYKGGFGPFPDEENWYGGNRFKAIQPWEQPDDDFPDVKNADAAIKFLQEDHEKPFLLYYGLWRPHSPYSAPKRFFEMYNEEEIVIPQGRQAGDMDDIPFLGQMLADSLKFISNNQQIPFDELYRKFIYAYCANTSFADWNVGRVIEALDKSRYADNTLVIFYSDNGFHCGEKWRWGKSTLYDQADYVPFLVRAPGLEGRISTATVSLVDVYPTLVEYCGLRPPAHSLDGQSFLRVLNEPDYVWERPSFTSYGVHYSGVRSEKYRYIQYPDGSEEVYNYALDPFEQNNIAGTEKGQNVKEELIKYIPENWAPSLGGRLEVPRDYEGQKNHRQENKVYPPEG